MRRVVFGLNDLKSQYPLIAREWDYERNAPLTPQNVACGSNKKYWWICSLGHHYEASPNSRTTKNSGCKYCANKAVLRGFNDLLSANPMLAAEWDFTKNYPYTPEMFTVGSDKKFFWKCKNGHDSYLASIKKRSSGRGCPICGRKKAGKTKTATIIRTKGSVRDSFPLLAAEWDSERNKLGPESYPVESAEYVWWKCSLCGHHWSARIVSRTRMNSGCPNCNYRNKTSFPEQALLYYVKLLFPDVHNNSTAVLDNNLELDIYIPSQSIGIEYDGIIWHGEKRRVTDKRKYQICKKQGITLYRVRESNEDASDICDFYIVRSDSSSTESLDAAIRELLNLISKKPDVINVDSNRDRALIKAQYMVMLKNNSLQEKYPDIATEWHPMKNGEITPSMVYAHSQDIFWWICPHCGYEYEKRVSDRTRQNPSGCKKCSSKRKAEWKQCLSLIPGVNDLATLYPNLLEEWDYSKNTDVSPENVTVGSHKEVAWICCNCGYRWNTSVYNRTQGHGCPECGKKRAAETRRQKSIHSHGSLLEAYPEIAKQWDYEANKGITPDSISSNDSIQKCSWICSCGAKWESTVYSLTHSKYVGCRKCRYKQAGEYRKAHPEANPVFGHHLTKETKAKISAALSGEKNYWYGKKGEMSPNYGKTFSDEHKAKISSALRGRKKSAETRARLSQAKLGKKMGAENHQSKAVRQLTMDGELIAEYDSISSAEKALGITAQRSHIGDVCRGKRNNAYGFRWEFVDN